MGEGELHEQQECTNIHEKCASFLFSVYGGG